MIPYGTPAANQVYRYAPLTPTPLSPPARGERGLSVGWLPT
jgi:hypothetical protein